MSTSQTPAEKRRGFREIVLAPEEVPATTVSTRARLPHFYPLEQNADPAALLSRLRVACVGVGAVGRNAAVHLARLGIGALYVIDPGTYKEESVLTQPIDPVEIGRSKAECVARLVKRISPATTVYVCDTPVETLGTTALADVDLVVLATDNIRAELECGQRCIHLGKPLVHAAVHGSTSAVSAPASGKLAAMARTATGFGSQLGSNGGEGGALGPGAGGTVCRAGGTVFVPPPTSSR